MANDTTGGITTEQEALKSGYDRPGLWLNKIARAKKDERDWHGKAKEAVAIYEARDEDGKDGSTIGLPSFNILHSNIEITVPSLYNSTPIADVRRRFGDADPIAKQAVDVIERALAFSLDQYDFDGTMVESTRDAELAGRGVPRVRYEPMLETKKDAEGADYESVGYQQVTCEHVTWDRWGHGPATSWEKVPWIYFEHDFTADDLKTLGVSAARIKSLCFETSDEHKGGEDEREREPKGIMKSCPGYEIWDKASRKVYFIASSDKKEFLATKPDPLKLEQFFPIPKAMQPLKTRASLTPIVPYEIYKTQVQELDKITKRITSLIGQCKVRGLYDKRLEAALDRLRYCEDGQYEPAEDAGQFQQGGGGLENALAHWPLEPIIIALKELYVQREQIKQTIYEITGLSDVLRGATDPNETLGAQQLKAQQGSTRLSQRQRMVAECCRQILRMKAEIICNHFTTENLSAMTGLEINPQVDQVLRSDLMRSYRIDIETDSTIRADLARSQEQMTRFLEGTAAYGQAMAPVLEGFPGAKPAVVEIYAAFARNFKLGKTAEDALEQLSQMAQQPEEPKPSPEEQKMQLEQQKMQMQAQMDQQKQQAEMQKMQAELEMKREMAELDKQMKMLDLQLAREKAQLEMQTKEAELGFKQQAMQMDQQAKVYDIQTKREMSELDVQSRRDKAAADGEALEMKAEHSREMGEQKIAQAKAAAKAKPKAGAAE